MSQSFGFAHPEFAGIIAVTGNRTLTRDKLCYFRAMRWSQLLDQRFGVRAAGCTGNSSDTAEPSFRGSDAPELSPVV